MLDVKKLSTNSSVAAVNLGKQLVKDFYQLKITCALEGGLAKAAVGNAKI